MSPENMGRLNCSSNSIRLPLWEEEVVFNCMKCESTVHLAEGKYADFFFLNKSQKNSSTDTLRETDLSWTSALIHSQSILKSWPELLLLTLYIQAMLIVDVVPRINYLICSVLLHFLFSEMEDPQRNEYKWPAMYLHESRICSSEHLLLFLPSVTFALSSFPEKPPKPLM